MIYGLVTALFITVGGWIYTIEVLLRTWQEMEKMVYPEEPEEEYGPPTYDPPTEKEYDSPTDKEEVIDSMIEELESM